MNVIMLAPGYPGEMPYFCRALSVHGAKVYGLSDVPYQDLPSLTREHLSGYLQVANFTDEEAVVRQVVASVGSNRIDRVACLWEPGVVLAAKLREALGAPGQGVEQAITFRNKDLMKQVIAKAGIRTARHASARSIAEVKAAAEEIANGPIFQKMYEDVAGQSGVRIFAVYGQRTPRGVQNAKRAIVKPDDMKGLKIRIPPIDGMRQFVGMLGAQGVVMGLGDTYQGISRGQVDGHENGIDAAISFKWYEVAKHWSETAHMYETAAWYMPEKIWLSLTPDQKKAFVAAAKTGGAVVTQLGEKIEKDGLVTFKENGVTVSQPDRAAFEATLKDAYKQSEGKLWAPGLVEQIRALPNNK